MKAKCAEASPLPKDPSKLVVRARAARIRMNPNLCVSCPRPPTPMPAACYVTKLGFVVHRLCYKLATLAIDDRDYFYRRYGVVTTTRTRWRKGAECPLCHGKTRNPKEFKP